MLRDSTSTGGLRKRSILVVEDDPAVSELLARTMTGAGYEVRRALGAGEALRAFALRQPDLVLLDLGLPDGDGLDVLRQFRQLGSPDVGVIVISGRAAEHHRLAGFEAGADDYVTKPFSPGEVAARVGAILRRRAGRPANEPGSPLGGGPLQVEPAARRVTCEGRPVALTQLEYRLLLDLVMRPGVVRTRAQLIDAAWGAELRAEANTVTVHIQRLRGKLRAAGCEPRVVQTVRGLGYRFEGTEAGSASA